MRREAHLDGRRLVLHSGARYFGAEPDVHLRRLIRENRAACWLIVHGSRATQDWFARERVPAVAAGSAHQGIDVPSVRIDVEAVVRHAVGILGRLGHRRIAFLNLDADRAGDHESDRAFLATAETSRASIQAEVAHHELGVVSIERAIRRLLGKASPPTAVLVGHSYTYLGVVTALARLRLRIPEDISVLSREDDPFLAALVPEPARYVANPYQYGKRIYRAIGSVCVSGMRATFPQPLVPEFRRGASIGPPAA